MAFRYREIADDLRGRIEVGQLAAGARLPSEAALARQYKTSTPTIRNALDVLQLEGLVDKRHGDGNFVRRACRRLDYMSGEGATEPSEPLSVELWIRVRVAEIQASGEVASLLRTPKGSRLTQCLYLHMEEDVPHSMARIYVPWSVAQLRVPKVTRSPWGDDVRRLLAKAGVVVVSVVSRVVARPPNQEEKQRLRLDPRTSVLAVERVSTDAEGRVVELALLSLPSDRAGAVFAHTMVDRIGAAR
ncbi:GntR family transcriptional regulator [Streptomyces sp. NPDC059070]|uniref:GntR family transcriptional regulator n=1 Tax=Streptomyces sp. NPDC059070 TaxID=3346713 RepID=UPI0036C0F99D